MAKEACLRRLRYSAYLDSVPELKTQCRSGHQTAGNDRLATVATELRDEVLTQRRMPNKCPTHCIARNIAQISDAIMPYSQTGVMTIAAEIAAPPEIHGKL